MTTTTDAVQADTATADKWAVIIQGSELARVIGNVLPFAATDQQAPPVLESVWFVAANGGFAMVACDRYTLAVATGSTDDGRRGAPGASVVARSGGKPVGGIHLADAKTLLAAAKRAKRLPMVLTIENGVLTVDVDSSTMTFTLMFGEFPKWSQLLLSEDRTPALTEGGICFNPSQLARFAKVADTAGKAGKLPMRMQFGEDNRPVLVTIGDTFTGLIMPTRLAG